MLIKNKNGEVISEVSGNTLSRANLSEKDLSGVELFWAKLDFAKLTGANLNGSSLDYANLNWADLSGANLSYSKATHVNFSHSKLCGADLSFSSLDYSEFAAVDFTGANWTGTILEGGPEVKNLIGKIIFYSAGVGVFETKSIGQWICLVARINAVKPNPYLTRLNATRVLLKNGITIMPDWDGGHDKAHKWLCRQHDAIFQAGKLR